MTSRLHKHRKAQDTELRKSSPESLKKQYKISIHEPDTSDLDPQSWKYYYKKEKEKKAQMEVGLKSGTSSVPHLSPQKNAEVGSTGLQSVAKIRGAAPLLINVSRNDMNSMKPFQLKEAHTSRLSTKKPDYENAKSVLSRKKNNAAFVA